MDKAQQLILYVVRKYGVISHFKLMTVLFLFDCEWLRTTTKPFTDLVYIKSGNRVRLDSDINMPQITYVPEIDSYEYIGNKEEDEKFSLNKFEQQIMWTVDHLIETATNLDEIYQQDAIWKDTISGDILDWNEYVDLYKDDRPKILDPETHNRILNLKIGTNPIWPLVNGEIIASKNTKEDSLETLDKISKLEKNWNLYGADPISPSIIEKTKEIISNLHYQPDNIGPYPGGVQLEFYRNGHKDDYLEISISESDDSITYLEEVSIPKEKINHIVDRFYL